MKVNYLPKIKRFISPIKKDEIYYALNDAADGLKALKTSVETLTTESEIASGNADGTNRVFGVQNTPAFVVVNGAIVLKSSYSYINNKITFKVAPAASTVIESYFI
jgi:hypothetical protein